MDFRKIQAPVTAFKVGSCVIIFSLHCCSGLSMRTTHHSTVASKLPSEFELHFEYQCQQAREASNA
jgi:hypothetical protein